MKLRLPSLLHGILLLAASSLAGQDGLLPTAYPVIRYSEIWENSPFERVVIKEVVSGPQSSFAQNLVLEGVVTDDTRGTVAYVRDIREDKPLVITSNESGDHPYRVVSANQEHNPEATKVTITDGKETGEIGFNAQKLTQAITAPVAAPSAAPGLAPGGQPRPGNQPPGRDGKDKPQLPQSPQTPQSPAAGVAVPPVPVTDNPGSGAPVLDKIDNEPRRRRVPLPGQ